MQFLPTNDLMEMKQFSAVYGLNREIKGNWLNWEMGKSITTWNTSQKGESPISCSIESILTENDNKPDIVLLCTF